jgi:transposase
MKTITTIGIDLAKNSFSVYGADTKGKSVLRRTLSRSGVTRFFANLPACLWIWKPVRRRNTGPGRPRPSKAWGIMYNLKV